MLYQKNLPLWERLTRFAAAAAMAACAAFYWGTLAGFVFAGLAVIAAGTALFGYCPACAVAGRTPPAAPRG